MSRTGKLPVLVPENVNVCVDHNTVTVEGPKGKLMKTFNSSVGIEKNENKITVNPLHNSRLSRAMYGTARSIINSMVRGVVEGFSKDLEISGVGFKAALKGNSLELALGYSHPIVYDLPQDISVDITDNTKLKVSGIDKHLVGQVAADIKSFYPVEPYKAKGVKIIGEHVIRKEGKKSSR